MNIRMKRTLPWLVIGVCVFSQYALAQPPIPVIFDTDMANDCDDAGALAVLHALADLGEQKDGSVVLCSVGALSNLEDLLRSGPDAISPLSGSELIPTKVKQTVIMGGGFPRTARPETNLRLDPPAAIAVTKEWPGTILWQGYEVGAALYTGAELKALPDTNPIKIAVASRPFRGISALEAGKPSHDQAAVLLAVRGVEPDYWQLTKGGRVVIDSDGHSQWMKDRPSDHAFVSIKSHPRDLTSIIAKLMTVSPKTK